MRNLFTPEEKDDEPCDPGEDRRCSPEKLLAFIQDHRRTTGKKPTLEDCKRRFGGILGPMVDFWELRRRGLA